MFQWLIELPQTNPIAHGLGLIALVCAAGMAVGSIRVKGIGLGSSGVLFMGILVAQFTRPIDQHILSFTRELGLILFVFTIGLQLGPGFFASLRAEGVKLNLLAAALIGLCGLLTPLLGLWLGIDRESFAGLFAGASTNSPALGAAQQTLASLPDITPEQRALPALACAVSYPIAIAALLGTILLLKAMFRIDPVKEAEDYAAEQRKSIEPIERRTLIVDNWDLAGVTLDALYERVGGGIVVSRFRRSEQSPVQTAWRDTPVHVGDTLLAVGTTKQLDQFERLVGRRSDEDLMSAPGHIASRQIIVTHKNALRRTPAELGLESQFGVEITRLTRGDIEMTVVPNLRLHFGDVVRVVGPEDQLPKVANYLGNSLKKLNETQFIPLFLGIFLGILIGSIPLRFPGLMLPVRLGLAGGPLIVALILGRIGNLGALVWHMPPNANHAFREFGVALFFAALGLAAGEHFVEAAFSPRGLNWLIAGFLLTVIPLLVIGVWSRLVEKMNFVTLGGMLAGGMTNPPALSFVSNLCRSESPALAYATVYPLTTLMRILIAQIIALTFCG